MKKLRLLWLGLCFVLVACSSQEVLLRDLTERDANDVIGALYTSSINAEKVVENKGKSFAVKVRSSDLPRAVSVLKALGLPKANRPSINDVFKSSGFAPTPFEERIRFIYGTTQEIERTISLIEGVLNTRVHVVIPEQNKRAKEVAQAKASVLINYDDRYDLSPQLPKIRKIVAESIDGLSSENVEILVTPTKVQLEKVASVPIVNFLGVRIHRDDFILFMVLFSIPWLMVTILVALLRDKIVLLMKKWK